MVSHTARATAALASLALLVGAGTFAQLTAAQTSPPPTPTARPPHPAHQERHPEIHAALRKLQSAKLDLQKAAHDFGGERAEALNDVNKAITELQNALAKDPH